MSQAVLVTIPFSHYCEKARWALDLSTIDYREEAHAPLVHWFYTLPRTGTRTVPVLITDKKKLTESSDIVRYASDTLPKEKSLYPEEHAREIEELVARYDDKIGVPTRRLAWCHVSESRTLFAELSKVLPSGEQRVIQRIEGGFRALMRRAFKVSPRARARMREKVLAELALVGERLNGRRYLVGDRFTAADLTLASLITPVIMPSMTVAEVHALDRDFGDLIAELRATPAGAHALRVIREHRP
jgi:glutathione S-transferase